MTFLKRAAATLVLFFAWNFSAHADAFFIAEEQLDPESFPTVAQALRESLEEPGETQLAPAKKHDVLRSLTELETLVANGDDSRRAERKRNTLRQRINHALAVPVVNNNRKDVVCSNVRKVNSRIPTTECRDRIVSKEDERDSREHLRRTMESVNTCHNPPCGEG